MLVSQKPYHQMLFVCYGYVTVRSYLWQRAYNMLPGERLQSCIYLPIAGRYMLRRNGHPDICLSNETWTTRNNAILCRCLFTTWLTASDRWDICLLWDRCSTFVYLMSGSTHTHTHTHKHTHTQINAYTHIYQPTHRYTHTPMYTRKNHKLIHE